MLLVCPLTAGVLFGWRMALCALPAGLCGIFALTIPAGLPRLAAAERASLCAKAGWLILRASGKHNEHKRSDGDEDYTRVLPDDETDGEYVALSRAFRDGGDGTVGADLSKTDRGDMLRHSIRIGESRSLAAQLFISAQEDLQRYTGTGDVLNVRHRNTLCHIVEGPSTSALASC